MIQDVFGNVRYKVGLHVHTTNSDGKVSPEESARIYKEAGFDAIALTDHWFYHGEDELSGLKIISGCEYNMGASDTAVDVMHIVGVGMKNDPEIDRATASRQDVIDSIRRAGGIAILAHPAWSLNTPAHAKELTGFAAMEIYNTVSDAGQSSRPYSGYFTDLLANEGIAYSQIATDDAHYYDGSDATRSYIMVNAESDSTEDLLRAVEAGNFYATQGPELHVKREGDKIIVDCSPCVKIAMFSNASWAPHRVSRGEALTHWEYPLHKCDKWVRAEVKDADGNEAWSNVIFVD